MYHRGPQPLGHGLLLVYSLLGTRPHSKRWADSERANKASSAAPHCSHYCLSHPPTTNNHPPPSVEKLSSTKPVPGTKNVGDCWCITCQGKPRIPPKAGRGREGSSPRPSQGAWPCWHLDFGLGVSRTGRDTFLLLKAVQCDVVIQGGTGKGELRLTCGVYHVPGWGLGLYWQTKIWLLTVSDPGAWGNGEQ